ncbi:helix-turn-helix transcriptional regulator [Humibacter sp. RRB41]|uniref:ArsR/SmtB family transcription factor n=1 Tax=Humibacter sp. RRB41 TaxID=2919946 RepID=UPI001FA9BCEC|nr:metalloregulator ArsR/SmtB family transcription factor [Humibacter sp. RRB41]
MLNQLDDVFHALADPSRRAIVERLAEGEASVSELARPLPMSLPAVIQHLQVLEASGLVSSTKAGRVRTCRLDLDALDRAQSWFQARRADWNQRLDRLGEYLGGAQGTAANEHRAASTERQAPSRKH